MYFPEAPGEVGKNNELTRFGFTSEYLRTKFYNLGTFTQKFHRPYKGSEEN